MINVYKILNKKQTTKNLMKEDFMEDLMSFEIPEADEYEDLENPEEYDESADFTEDLNDDVTQELEDPDDIQEEPVEQEDGDISKNKKLGTALVKILRDEISSKKEYERDFLRFRYRGEICDGVPMSEINPSRFVFKIDNILKAINLSEIKIL